MSTDAKITLTILVLSGLLIGTVLCLVDNIAQRRALEKRVEWLDESLKSSQEANQFKYDLLESYWTLCDDMDSIAKMHPEVISDSFKHHRKVVEKIESSQL